MIQKLVASAALFVFPLYIAAQEVTKKEWTILVFLNADNNLESFGYDDVREMERVGSTENVNVVVQFDGVSPSGSPRFLVEKNGEKPYTAPRKSFNSTIIDDLPEQDMGDYRTLESFIQWGTEKFPAKHYALVLWNHGSGWKKEDDVSLVKGISYDDTSGNHITTRQMVDSLASAKTKMGQKMDVIAFDACLMAMVEVVDGFVGLADYVVGSEEVVPGPGLPYDKVLKTFTGREDKTARALVSDLVMEFGLSYSGGSQGISDVTLSAIDMNEFDFFKRKMNVWLEALETKSNLSTEQMKADASVSQAFYDSEYRDLGDYVNNLLQTKLDEEGMDEAQARSTKGVGFIANSLALLDAIDRVVVERFASTKYRKARGLSIYLPYAWGSWSSWSSTYSSDVALKNEYLKLSWTGATTWSNHLDRLFPSR